MTRICLEAASAERAVLLLGPAKSFVIRATAAATGEVFSRIRRFVIGCVPVSIVGHVANTGERSSWAARPVRAGSRPTLT